MRGVLLLLTVLAAGPRPTPAPRPVPPPRGTVSGALRYKDCQAAPSGASLSVIGREATTAADASGRFSVSLPPGTYSLVIGGPGLVPDQRVDDVVVTLGQTRDLGTVEVWPEERPAGCGPGAPPPPPAAAVVATVPDTPALDLPGAGVAPSHVAPDQVWVRGSAGAAAGQFGLQGDPARDDEDALGPASFAIGPQGSLWVLDALNGRLLRFDPRGHPSGSFAIASHPDDPVVEADLAIGEDGHVFIFTQGDVPTVAEYDPSGPLLITGPLPISFKAVEGLFSVRQRPLFLMQNGQAVRAELGWGGLRAEGPLPGVPAGELFARAERVDRWRAALKLSTADGRVRRSVQLHSRVPITGVRLVGVDRRGDVVLAVDRAENADDPAPRAEVLLLSIDQLGHLGGAASVPPGNRRFEFRELALAPDGTVLQMQSDVGEVRFVRWTLRPPPRDVMAGEGLLRGRVVEAGRPVPGAHVVIARPRRPVPVAPDGSFEVRLPAGTYTVQVRGSASPGAEPPSAEVKVAVAAGATVDLGNVPLAARVPRASPPGSAAAPAAAAAP